MKTKCDKEVIPNTWGDLRDIDLNEKTYRVTDEGITEVEFDPTFYTKILDSLGAVYLGKSYYVDLDKNIAESGDCYRLSDYISKIPHGIVDKKRPGIGATTVEINSRRNSIIVVPTKTLAYNKTLKHSHCQYVGSKIGTKRGAVLLHELQDYINNKDIEYKKFIVVADSLERVTKLIGDNVYNNYFLMVDEVDMLQSDSNYRPALENVMDYYFRFNKKNRCLLTATMKEFSNPLLQYETRFDLTDFKPKRKIHVVHTDNINAAVKIGIELYNNEKILIAYNSISQIMGIIYNLDEKLQKDCSILCSEASEKETAGFYAELTDKNKLPNRIVFMTCSYFAGVDIEDKYHLITVSNAERFYQTLSIDKMTQIAGRCRIENGLLSETIVYNTPNKSATLLSGDIKDICLNKAQKILNLYDSADEICKYDNELVKLFSIVKKAIQEKANERIGGEEINLTRQNIDGKYVPAYFNIDSIVEKEILDSGYYMDKKMLVNELSKTNKILSFEPISINKKESQRIAEEKSINNIKELFDIYIEEAIAYIKQLEATGRLNDSNLNIVMRNAKRNAKDFYNRFIKLYKYADTDIILDLLWEIRAENKKSLKGVNNAVIFWALEDNHPFKLDISNMIRLGEVYTANELHALLIPIISYSSLKEIKPRASISLIKACYNIERPRTKYKVIGENPKGFKEQKLRISKGENLINYFMI